MLLSFTPLAAGGAVSNSQAARGPGNLLGKLESYQMGVNWNIPFKCRRLKPWVDVFQRISEEWKSRVQRQADFCFLGCMLRKFLGEPLKLDHILAFCQASFRMTLSPAGFHMLAPGTLSLSFSGWSFGVQRLSEFTFLPGLLRSSREGPCGWWEQSKSHAGALLAFCINQGISTSFSPLFA